VHIIKDILTPLVSPMPNDVLEALIVRKIFGDDPSMNKILAQDAEEFLREHMNILGWMHKRGIVERYVYEDSDVYYWGVGLTDPKWKNEPPLPDYVKAQLPIRMDKEKLLTFLEEYVQESLTREEREVADEIEAEDHVDDEEERENAALKKIRDDIMAPPVAPVVHRFDDTALRREIQALQEQIAEMEGRQIHFKNRLEDMDKARKVELTIICDNKKLIVKDRTHPVFAQVMFHIKQGDNVMLVGPKGCGKTYVAKQIAKHLKLQHGQLSLSGGVTESKLFGRVTPNITNGKEVYHPTRFAILFEGGGLFLLDEVDAADPNVVVSLNGALEDGELPLDRPNKGYAKRHKDFICMAAANTWGNGCDRQYVGRNQQDSAFTERFVQIEMNYDEGLELALCPGTEDFVRKMHEYRKRLIANKLERTISTRYLRRAHKWLKAGKDEDYCESLLFGGWRADEIRKVKGAA